MIQDVHLYIGGKEVEFTTNPQILFNFKETDLTNPTTIKNSWTKSVSIKSTPTNDDIFNHFWNLERNQDGLDFNPLLKTDFELYINATLIQKGYCKLDNVKMVDGTIQYQVTCYGLLGDFFYNLSYDQGEVGDKKKTLASLNYADTPNGVDPNLDFIINKETLHTAWDAMCGVPAQTPYDDKWDVINFVPSANGIPDNFDASKILLNYRGINTNVFYRNWNDSDDGGWPGSTHHYQPIYNGSKNMSGYSVAEANQELTCDQTFDLRSYLQRPVVNVWRTIQACCNPDNNGGYQVKLDPHFFQDSNPYYYGKYAWLTLPMLKDLEIKGGQTEEITGATIENTSNRRVKNINFTSGSSLSEINNIRLRLNVGISTDYTGNSLSTWITAQYNDTATLQRNKYVKKFEYNCGVVVQLIAKDTNGNICATSKAYCLSSYQYYPHYGGNIWDGFEIPGYPTPTEYKFLRGKWFKINGQWRWCDAYGNQQDIEFTFPASTPISTIEMLIQANEAHWTKYKFYGKGGEQITDTTNAYGWVADTINGSGLHQLAEVYSNYGHRINFTYDITSFYAEARDYESLFSGTFIPKDKLLSTSYSPADFLISYAKLFGLYFYMDPGEESDDPVLYPKGVIHIMDRDTFYTEEYVDLEPRIDHSKEMTISPTVAGSKWYSFDLEHIDSQAEKDYESTYGTTYGRQVVNTNYNFDNNTTELYDGNVFKSGIMVWERDKYFSQPSSGTYEPPTPVYMLDGLQYTLYDPSSAGTGDMFSYDLELPTKISTKTPINIEGMTFYDVFPKLQCHSDNNSASEGDGVLLFYIKPIWNIPNNYWITDDVLEMQTLNGGNACWLFTNSELDAGGNRIAYKVNYLPYFSRDWVNYALNSGDIVNSWNFGHPQTTFCPNTYSTDGDSIYDKCWKDYIRDMYDVNGRKLTCFVNLQGIPSNAWLRKWYHFNNSIWRLNEIKDWNAADPATTQCEFIKVQDVHNYELAQIKEEGSNKVVLDSYTIGHNGGTITGWVIIQNGGPWSTLDEQGLIIGDNQQGVTYYEYNAISPVKGTGTTQITITVPASSASTPIYWTFYFEDMPDLTTTFIQEGAEGVCFININETGVALPALGGTSGVTYNQQNIVASSITASLSQSWVTGTVDTVAQTVTLTAGANESPGILRATLTLSGIGTDGVLYSSTCQVAQPPYGSFYINGSPVTFDYDEDLWTDRQILTISADTTTSWTITSFNDLP